MKKQKKNKSGSIGTRIGYENYEKLHEVREDLFFEFGMKTTTLQLVDACIKLVSEKQIKQAFIDQMIKKLQGVK